MRSGIGVNASSLPPPCRVPAPICGSIAPSSSCPMMWKATSLEARPSVASRHAAIDCVRKKIECRCGTPSFSRKATESVLWQVWMTTCGWNSSICCS